MRPRLKFRAVVYPLFLVPILTVLFLALALCLRNGEVPTRLVNSGVLARLLARAGVQYTIQSLHVGCLQQNCGSEVDAGGIELHLPGAESTVNVDHLHWCSVHPLEIRGFKLTTPDMRTVQV